MTRTLVDACPAAGLCECGCGQRTRIETRTDARFGAVAGRPRRFISGHNAAQAGAVRPKHRSSAPPASAPGAPRCAAGCGYPIVSGGRRTQVPAGWRLHCGRGLCESCHDRMRRHDPDALLDFERWHRTRDDVLDDWAALRAQGAGRREAARRIGITTSALEAHIHRGRRDGDRRAVMGTP
ncbi:MAG: hypothetical protein ACRCZP_10995 [Phycicoccus sp.]